ncbi:unnamed protein product [Effrenium voratum]|uniref:Uncharacterized protein n=1 Tax=Effrenium voratum TaxID=2562239 RepID=A0AA36JJS9_9DINO|nr:unnamed protein product [Effrenium voratum]
MAAFPGQIASRTHEHFFLSVGVVGRSGMTGSTFHAWEFLSGLPHPLEPLSPSSSLHALVLAGPFSEKEKLDFSALDSALADAALVRPEVRPEKLFAQAMN